MVDPAVSSKPHPPKLSRKPFWTGVLVGALAMAALLTMVSVFRSGSGSVATTEFLASNRRATGVIETPSGLQYKVLRTGEGARATDADAALVTYTGRLIDGTVFNQSRRPTPLPVSGVVPGFAEALKLMPKGATYRLWIKPELAYGNRANGPIPASSVLVFDVTLDNVL